MKTGSIKVEDSEQTWETLKSAGKTWREINDTINIPHMALLRNLRGIFDEIQDVEYAKTIVAKLKAGVAKGMQFPFRYWSAYNAIKKSSANHQQILLDALEECIDLAVSNMPKLSGKVMSLCDNSGSAQGSFNSEYGTVNIATIANLSALITARQSDEGFVGVFGDRLDVREPSKRNGILSLLQDSNRIGSTIGSGTENGIWLFLKNAIDKKEHWDTIFIYSDMQAGHGGLYGTTPTEYREFGYKTNTRHIDVLKLIEKYRREVNAKVNVFSVQVAGYDNNILPENLYRGAILTGWTGKEPIYAKEIIDTWNAIEAQ